jgi:hypothetical protein
MFGVMKQATYFTRVLIAFSKEEASKIIRWLGKVEQKIKIVEFDHVNSKEYGWTRTELEMFIYTLDSDKGIKVKRKTDNRMDSDTASLRIIGGRTIRRLENYLKREEINTGHYEIARQRGGDYSIHNNISIREIRFDEFDELSGLIESEGVIGGNKLIDLMESGGGYLDSSCVRYPNQFLKKLLRKYQSKQAAKLKPVDALRYE